ncbi:hypothetical protein AMJ83_06485 [candidate division WOR_3 bacterium SM23_42]|uniref:Phospholipid/glycerol acyltransferase domain-containing protein n=1 Tax=candidate division WOR_3 bacterium SM23_42 TaxID=1703779 RepID=A0A0S8FV79_UNCW3|nr:MAG: hypothetical protein AMJ83_06485 [candidate division WOR_3 bacterium SM23_42]
MYLLAECAFLSLMFSLYWLCRQRRRYLIRRIGKRAFDNVYHVGRNIFFMLRRYTLEISGDTSALSRGCILYSFHFGVWELMPPTLAKMGYRLGIIVNRNSETNGPIIGKLFDTLLHRWRSMIGVTVFYKENTLEIVRFLKSGGIFGILVDGDTMFQKFPKTQKLARLCRVPLIPFAAYRRAGKGVLDVGCDLPDLVRTMPNEYMWFYKSR